MYYDPIKNIFAGLIRKYPFIRVTFYKILDMMFLRSWYVRGALKNIRGIFGTKEIDIYDAGSGYGQYTYFMANNLSPCRIYASDIKEEWIKDCTEFFGSRKFDRVSFSVEDLLTITHDEKFDLIVCVDVMEHIADDGAVFENFYKSLKRSGYLLINSPSIFGGSDVHEENEESFIGEHARDGYSKEDLESKLHPIGFTTCTTKYTYGFWGDKAWRFGIKYPMVMLNFSKLLFIILPLYYLLTFPFTLLMMFIDYKSDNKVGTGINFIAQKK